MLGGELVAESGVATAMVVEGEVVEERSPGLSVRLEALAVLLLWPRPGWRVPGPFVALAEV